MHKYRNLLYISLLCYIFLIGGCAAPPSQPLYPPTSMTPPSISTVICPPTLTRHTVIHTVAPGETLWRLSKMYDVRIEDIMRANRLRDKTKLEKGQELKIPSAAPPKPVIALFPTKKWRYIIVHHSATDEGNALDFDQMHLKKGWDRGLGYHFVIDNGTGGKSDGNIEVAPRWIKQQDGAHCKASDMNKKGIGICLVGNFSKGNTVSRAQMDALVYLVKMLQDYYKIPDRNILGHGQVRDAHTECPGLNFPWSEFKRRLG